MDKGMLLLLVAIAVGFLAAMVMDDLVLTIGIVAYSIIWVGFHLGDKLDKLDEHRG